MGKLNFRKGFAVGMVHLPPVSKCRYGTYSDIRALVDQAVSDAYVLQECGFDSVMVQNGKDVCRKYESDNFTVAMISEVCGEIRSKLSVPIGINVLKNDVTTALSAAKITDLQFVRCKVYVGAAVSGEGIIEGCAERAISYRDEIGADDIEIWSETYDLSSRPIHQLSFEDTVKWCKKMHSDSYIVCGHTHDDTLAYCGAARKIVGNAKVIIGGGVNLKNLEQSIGACDGFIVGSAVEKVPFTGPVSPKLAEEFMRHVTAARQNV